MRAIYLAFLLTLPVSASCDSKHSIERRGTTTSATTPDNHTQAPGPPPPSATGVTSSKENQMLTGKPYLSIQVEATRVAFDVFVNSGYVSTDLTATVASEKWPINPLLRSGANEIGVIVYYWGDGPDESFDDDSKLALRVSLRQADSTDGPEYELMTIAVQGNSMNTDLVTDGTTADGRLDSGRGFSPAETGDVEVGPLKIRRIREDNAIILTRTLNLRLPFPEWAFLRSDRQIPVVELSESDARIEHDKLLVAYEEIWSLLAARNLDLLMPRFEERSREIDLALYQEPGTTQGKLREAFESALADPSCSLDAVRRKNGRWYYNVAPGGQLARLTTSKHGGAAIRFSFESSGYARVFPIMFRKEGSRYIVAR